jgi:hypothetical protein
VSRRQKPSFASVADVVAQAKRMGTTHVLHAYDAVQLAVAIEASPYHREKGPTPSAPITLIPADQALNDAAFAEEREKRLSSHTCIPRL